MYQLEVNWSLLSGLRLSRRDFRYFMFGLAFDQGWQYLTRELTYFVLTKSFPNHAREIFRKLNQFINSRANFSERNPISFNYWNITIYDNDIMLILSQFHHLQQWCAIISSQVFAIAWTKCYFIVGSIDTNSHFKAIDSMYFTPSQLLSFCKFPGIVSRVTFTDFLVICIKFPSWELQFFLSVFYLNLEVSKAFLSFKLP